MMVYLALQFILVCSLLMCLKVPCSHQTTHVNSILFLCSHIIYINIYIMNHSLFVFVILLSLFELKEILRRGFSQPHCPQYLVRKEILIVINTTHERETRTLCSSFIISFWTIIYNGLVEWSYQWHYSLITRS